MVIVGEELRHLGRTAARRRSPKCRPPCNPMTTVKTTEHPCGRYFETGAQLKLRLLPHCQRGRQVLALLRVLASVRENRAERVLT